MFEDVRIVDNFYQTSSFFPMPTVLFGTLCEDGSTNLGSYSLCFPYYIAGKDYYAMLLQTRNSSNTAVNLLERNTCTINFIPHRRRYLKEAVRLGFPGDTSQEKMKDCIFTLEDGERAKADPETVYPKVVAESFQVFECTWMRDLDGAGDDKVMEEYQPPFHDFNGITSRPGAHFILRLDKILMKKKYYGSILRGTKKRLFPKVPVDYGFKDNAWFWMSRFRTPMRQPVPKGKGTGLDFVIYAADRIDPDIKFTEDACARLTGVPRVFLNTVLNGCADWARKNGVSEITPEHMDVIRDKWAKEKG